MSCKYNNSMYTITPPEIEEEIDSFEELLSYEEYETEEELNYRLNEEYEAFQIYELSNEEMLDFARAGEEYYNRRK